MSEQLGEPFVSELKKAGVTFNQLEPETKKAGPVMLTKATASQVIPQELQDRLIAIGDSKSVGQWEGGDIANILVEEHPGRSKAFIDSCVALFSKVKGITIADWRATCTFYPNDIRDKYELCSFSHFFAAKSAGSLKKASEWLNSCITSMDDYGGVVTPVDKLRALMADDGEVVDPPTAFKRMRSIYRSASMLLEETAFGDDEEYQQVALEIKSMIEKNIDSEVWE